MASDFMPRPHFSRERVRLDAIVFDAGTQIRESINEQVVTDYAERMIEGVEFPPITLFHDGVRYYLADGFHRTLAAKRNQFRDIAADVDAGTRADALWFALGANKVNGQRLTDADKKHAVKMAIDAFPDRSQTQIAEQVGCSQRYVSTIRDQVRTTSNLPDRVTGKDGKSYPAKRSDGDAKRGEIERRLVAGEGPAEIAKALSVRRNKVHEIKRAIGLAETVDKSHTAVQERRERMRSMAGEGYSSRQIAGALGLSEEGCRTAMRQEAIDVPADKVTRNTKHHDSNRIVERMVMDAENLCADVNLIDFSTLDRERLGEWLDSFKSSREQLMGFIRRLMKEQQKHVEAA